MVTLDSIITETIPLQEHPWNWLFEDNQGQLPPKEHLDQIYALNPTASRYLWMFEDQVKLNTFHPESRRYFRDYEEFSFGDGMEKEVKKWLFKRKIKFDTVVFMTFQPPEAFAMTWKMAIHYSPDLFFGHDTTVWDRSLNWALYYDHNDVFFFAQNRIYDGEREMQKLNSLIEQFGKQNKDFKVK